MKKVIWNFNFMLNYICTKETAFDQNLYSYTFFQQANKIYVMFAKVKDHFQWPKLVQVKKKKAPGLHSNEHCFDIVLLLEQVFVHWVTL